MTGRFVRKGKPFGFFMPKFLLKLAYKILEFLQKSAEDFKDLYDEIRIPQLVKYLKKPQEYDYNLSLY